MSACAATVCGSSYLSENGKLPFIKLLSGIFVFISDGVIYSDAPYTINSIVTNTAINAVNTLMVFLMPSPPLKRCRLNAISGIIIFPRITVLNQGKLFLYVNNVLLNIAKY